MSKKSSPNSICLNRKARHDYHIEEQFEAGLVLEGWEIKSLREGRGQIKDSYVRMKNGEAWLMGAHISPLETASTHINPDPTRSRKLLLHAKELNKLIGATERQGYTIIPLNIHLKRNRAKLEIALAKGKKTYDKRQSEKQQQWSRDKQRLLKKNI